MLVSGPWSDRHGRKVPILWCLLLDCLSIICVGVIYCVSTNHQLGIIYYFLPSVFYGLSGGAFNFFMLSFSYVGDLSHLEPETRLVRFSATETSLTCGTFVGYYIAGLVARNFGDLYVFIFTAAYFLLALVYCLVRIDNIVPQRSVGDGQEQTWAQKFREVLTLLSKPREGNLRQVILLLCALFILQETPRGFENTLQVNYIIDKFDWKSYQLLNLKAISSLFSAVGQFLIFPVLHRLMKVPLMLIGCLTVFSRVGHYLLFAFPLQSYYLFIAAGVNCLVGVQAILIRSGLATALPSMELGTVYAINEIVVTFLPIVLSPLASSIYRATTCSGCFQGAWAVVASIPITLQLPVFIVLYFIINN